MGVRYSCSKGSPVNGLVRLLSDLLPGSMDVDEECSLGAFAAATEHSVDDATPTVRLVKVDADKVKPAPHPSGQARAHRPQRTSLSAEERFQFDLAMVKRTVRFGVRGEEGYPFGGSSVA